MNKELTKEAVLQRLKDGGIPDGDLEAAFGLLLWYGLLGVKTAGKERFIYDYEYNMKRLEAEIRNSKQYPVLYVPNTAIHVALTT